MPKYYREKDLEVFVWGVLLDVFSSRHDNNREWVTIEEHTECNLNGGEPTGYFISARLADYGAELPELGKGCDGMFYWHRQYKHPLFKPCSCEY